MESLTGFSIPEMEAIEEFLRSCTVPLVRAEDDKLALLGTGTFFRLEERLWLVTAAHVIRDEADLKELGIPMKTAAQFLTLGNCTLYRPNNLNLDVAIVLVQDTEFEEYVYSNWRVLDDSNITRFNPAISRYIVAGYPRETLAKTAINWRKSFTQIHVGPYPGGAGDADHSMFRLAYSRTASDSSGSVTNTPSLSGVSGASVWAVMDAAAPPWAPEKVLKVVAVQVSFKHSDYIGAEWWTLVREVFRRWSDEQENSMPKGTLTQPTIPFEFSPSADEFEEHHLEYKDAPGGQSVTWAIVGVTIIIPSYEWSPDFDEIEKANGGLVKFHGLTGFSIGSYHELLIGALPSPIGFKMGKIEVTFGIATPLIAYLFQGLHREKYFGLWEHITTARIVGADHDEVEIAFINAAIRYNETFGIVPSIFAMDESLLFGEEVAAQPATIAQDPPHPRHRSNPFFLPWRVTIR
jgi:hypothetical protein